MNMNKLKMIIIFVLTFMLGALYTKALSGSYKVGDKVTYNNVDYYVIEDSDETESSVTLLKAEPLTTAEVNQYGAGHVNMNVPSNESYYQKAYDRNGYGGMVYYSSATCGYDGSEWVESGCTTDYTQSEIKYVVDAWKNAQAPAASIARLITIDELEDNLGYEQNPSVATQKVPNSTNTPSWVYFSNYYYWTMSSYEDSASIVWDVRGSEVGTNGANSNIYELVRPVIVLAKDKEDSAQDNTDSGSNITEPTKVDVPNTLFEEPYISTIVGGIIIIVSIIVCVVIINNKVNRKKDKDKDNI